MDVLRAEKQIVVCSSRFSAYAIRVTWRVDARTNHSRSASCNIRRARRATSVDRRSSAARPGKVLHMRTLRRRPSPAMVVALIALFVALGGPAQAKKRLMDGGLIRKGTVTSRADQERLRREGRPEQGSGALAERHAGQLRGVRADHRRPGARARSGRRIGGPDQLAAGAVTASKLAGDSIGGGSVANGSLQTVDIGSFTGSLRPVPDFAFTSRRRRARRVRRRPPPREASPTSPTTSSWSRRPATGTTTWSSAPGRPPGTRSASSPAGSHRGAEPLIARPDDPALRHLRRALAGLRGRFLTGSIRISQEDLSKGRHDPLHAAARRPHHPPPAHAAPPHRRGDAGDVHRGVAGRRRLGQGRATSTDDHHAVGRHPEPERRRDELGLRVPPSSDDQARTPAATTRAATTVPPPARARRAGP